MKPHIDKIVGSKVVSVLSYLSGVVTERPRDWNDVVLFTAEKLTDKPLYAQSYKYLLSNRNLFIYWSPVIFIYIAALLKRRIMYLCWGIPKTSNRLVNTLKRHKLKCILKKSDVLLVNDLQTYEDVYELTKKKAIVAPYIVDTDYYALSSQERDSYIVAPGDNDRDEELIRAIASHGQKIYRVARTPSVVDYHKCSPNVIIKYKIPYPELRLLYQKASAVILPISSSNHAAGQTAALEALACGAPVVISRGRTSTIFINNEAVQICSSNDDHEWLERIKDAQVKINNTVLIAKVRSHIEHMNSFDSLCQFFIKTIRENFILRK